MTTTPKKQTAANNAFLAEVKRIFNKPIFKGASARMNTEGETAARAFVQQFTTRRITIAPEWLGKEAEISIEMPADEVAAILADADRAVGRPASFEAAAFQEAR